MVTCRRRLAHRVAARAAAAASFARGSRGSRAAAGNSQVTGGAGRRRDTRGSRDTAAGEAQLVAFNSRSGEADMLSKHTVELQGSGDHGSRQRGASASFRRLMAGEMKSLSLLNL
ncbi:hypothetical protein PR202_ga08982 [Eleusine coracana subsp. coracana]|uniref:Uncharacterized protein n=1 Tax=Eleusine coracana subsp. coracana TaxID=191504 RepID=A0AAV5C1P7_ELECO|nr:hypothetical protein PR202_ga08982 [Eleusine coracana subsp. coracana]